MQKKQKVLHLLQSSRYSGAENVVTQIIEMFRDNDNIEMAYCSRDGQIAEVLEKHNITFYPIKKLGIKEVNRVVKEYCPDIIHAHDLTASVIASFIGKQINKISHVHVNHESMNNINLKTILFLVCSLRFKRIFWVSDSAFNKFRFKKQLSKKSSILFNVINRKSITDKLKIAEDSKKYDIVYIGRLTYQKNPFRLMHVLKLTIEKNSQIKVAIIGNGDLKESTQELSKKLCIDKNLSFLGFQSNPLRILHNAKVIVMTSRFEGTPMVALEAMELGVPIVSTPTDGLCDIVENKSTGYLSDEDDILAEKIIEIISNKELHDYLSKNALLKSIEINDTENFKEILGRTYYE